MCVCFRTVYHSKSSMMLATPPIRVFVSSLKVLTNSPQIDKRQKEQKKRKQKR